MNETTDPRHWNLEREIDRAIHEMLGMMRGILADGVVTDEEAAGLAAWIDEHPEVRERWPVDVLNQRLLRIFEDGRIDEEERTELTSLLQDISDGSASIAAGMAAGVPASSTLPLNEPEPDIGFEDSLFVFAGRLAFGTLSACHEEVLRRGGRCNRSLTEDTDFLVLGTLEHPDWTRSDFGRAIHRAVDYRDKRGLPLAIVCEATWAGAL